MPLFSVLFPREAGRLARTERLVARLTELTGYDEASDPAFEPVLAEIRVGHTIKATELYTKIVGCSLGEARIAVAELEARSERR